MWILVSKLLPLFVLPLNIALWMLLGSILALWWGWRRSAATMLFVGTLVLTVASMPPVAATLVRGLESVHPPRAPSDFPSADAIVVLGGALALPLPPRVGPEFTNGTDRIALAAALYAADRAKVVVVTGGNVFAHPGLEPEAHYIADLLRQWGVPAEAIRIEGNSRNTHQNAVNTARLLQDERLGRVLLVTSAFHMPRAAATFARAGVDLVPAPTDFIVTERSGPAVLYWIPSAGALGLTTGALRERLGILVYRVRGWI